MAAQGGAFGECPCLSGEGLFYMNQNVLPQWALETPELAWREDGGHVSGSRQLQSTSGGFVQWHNGVLYL